jgi:flagellar protein FlaG
VSTETVPALLATATKPASSDAPARQRTNAAPAYRPPVRAPEAPATNPVQDTMEKVAAQLESYLRSVGRSLQFSVDADSGRTVVSVRDSATGEVIRQIPNAEALRLAQRVGTQSNSLIDIVV